MSEVKQWPAGKPVPTRQRPARGRAAKNPSVASAIAAEAADDALPRYMEICQELNLSRLTASLYCPYKYGDARMRTTHATREAPSAQQPLPVNQTKDTVNKADPDTVASRVSSRIAAFAADLSFDAIPPAVTDRARHLMLDALGCTLAARDEEFAMARMKRGEVARKARIKTCEIRQARKSR